MAQVKPRTLSGFMELLTPAGRLTRRGPRISLK